MRFFRSLQHMFCDIAVLLFEMLQYIIFDLLKHLGINGIVYSVEIHCIALFVDLVLIVEIIGINDSIVILGYFPYLIID